MRTLKQIWKDSSLPWRVAYVVWMIWTALLVGRFVW